MAAGRRDLERALGVGVAADVREVEVVRAVFRGPGPAVGLLRRDVALTVQVLDGVVNGLDGNDGETAHHRGLKNCPSSTNSSTLSESASGSFDKPCVSPTCPAVSGPFYQT